MNENLSETLIEIYNGLCAISVKEEKKSQYDTSILRNPQKSSLKTAESQDDLGKLYKNLQKANLGIDGVNMERRRKSALNQDLLVAKSSRKSQEILSVKKLQSLQRTLKVGSSNQHHNTYRKKIL